MARPYPRQHSRTWYLKRRPYRIFILREWSSTFVAAYFVVLVRLAAKARDGEAALAAFVEDVLNHPLLILFHLVALAFAVLHTVTWFRAVPKGLRVRMGDEVVPGHLMIGANYAALAAISLVIAAALVL